MNTVAAYSSARCSGLALYGNVTLRRVGIITCTSSPAKCFMMCLKTKNQNPRPTLSMLAPVSVRSAPFRMWYFVSPQNVKRIWSVADSHGVAPPLRSSYTSSPCAQECE